MFYQARSRQTAALLTKFGQRVSIRRESAGEYDPTTGAVAPSAMAVQGIPAAVFGFMDADIDGTLIQRGDKRVLLASGLIVPQSNDIITIGGVDHTIISVKTLEPAGVAVMYTLQVRV